VLDCKDGHQEERHESEEVQTNLWQKIKGGKAHAKENSAQETGRHEEKYDQFREGVLNRWIFAAKGESQRQHTKEFKVQAGNRIALRRAIRRLAGIERPRRR
jgi:hypothetical protein